MNIMAQVPLEKKINMSYSAEELLVTCFFDGVSCDARSVVEGCSLSSKELGPLHAPAALLEDMGATLPFGKCLTRALDSRVSGEGGGEFRGIS